MRIFTADQLKEVKYKHKKWLNNEEGGERADLRSANLSYADLSYADLRKRYIQVSCIGSRKGMTTYCFDDDVIWCGCWMGSLKDFEKRVKETHKENKQYLAEYLGFIKYVKCLQTMIHIKNQ